MTFRPRRSALYMPGSNERALKKARELDCDVVILDLEDSVAPDAKEAARAQVAEALREGGFGRREVVVRINGLDTDWGKADLDAVIGKRPDGVLVPKVSSPDDLMPVQAALGSDSAVKVWAMMETPRAMLAAGAIAAARRTVSPALEVFVMGTNDLAKETRMRLLPGRVNYLPWLTTCLAAARAEGLDILDGVFNDLSDADGFAGECAQGRDLGFDGKTLIHPAQIAPCNEAFSPSTDEVEWARKVVEAFARPENEGRGAIRLDGKMVERLHADMARRVLSIATAL